MEELKANVEQKRNSLSAGYVDECLLKAKVEKYLARAEPLFAGLEPRGEGEKLYDMAMRYYSDAKHFYEKGEYVNALAALEYAEGWMDAGRELGLL
jgi:hypothetical protein